MDLRKPPTTHEEAHALRAALVETITAKQAALVRLPTPTRPLHPNDGSDRRALVAETLDLQGRLARVNAYLRGVVSGPETPITDHRDLLRGMLALVGRLEQEGANLTCEEFDLLDKVSDALDYV